MTERRRPRPTRGLFSDAGVALAEVLIAVVVIGVGMAVVVGSYAVGVRTTTRHGDLAYANVTANLVAEWVAGQDYSASGSYTKPPEDQYPPGWGPGNVVLTTSCWTAGSDPPTFGTCGAIDTRLQKVQIVLTGPRVSRTLEVLKRNPLP